MIRSLFAVLLTASFTLSAPPTITVPPTLQVEVYTIGTLEATGEATFYRWSVPKEFKFPKCLDLAKSPKSLEFVAPPGTYVVQVVAANAEGISEIQTVTVTVGTGGVGPNPTPVPPKPDPQPTPKLDAVHLVIVEDKLHRTAETVKIEESFADWRTTKGVKSLVTYDKESAGVYLAPAYKDGKIGDKAIDWSTPVVLVLDSTGNTVGRYLLNSFDFKKFVTETIK